MKFFWSHYPQVIVKRDNIITPSDCEYKLFNSVKKEGSEEQKEYYSVKYYINNMPAISICDSISGNDKHGQPYFLINIEKSDVKMNETLLADFVGADLGSQVVNALAKLKDDFKIPAMKTILIVVGVIVVVIIAWKLGWLNALTNLIPHSQGVPALTGNHTVITANNTIPLTGNQSITANITP